MVNADVKFYAYLSGNWVLLLDIVSPSGGWGIGDNTPSSRTPEIGRINLRLNNYDGRYTPDGPAPLAGWGKGVPLKMTVTYEGQERIRFRGFVEEIKLPEKPKDYIVNVTALDWLDYATKYPVVNPALLEDSTADEGITELLTGVSIQPVNTNISTGRHTFPTLFDTVRESTRFYGEASKLAFSELGYFYMRHDDADGETFVFESLDYRNGTRALKQVPVSSSESGALLLQGGGYLLLQGGGRRLLNSLQTPSFTNNQLSLSVEYGKDIINRFVSNAYPKRQDDIPLKIYESEKEELLAGGQTKTFRVFWRDQSGKRGINAIPPTGNSNIVALSHFNEHDGVLFNDETGKVWTASEADSFFNFAKYGDGSIYFDGSASYATTPHSPDWEFGSGDFWVEWWEWRNGTTSGHTVLSRDGTDSTPAFKFGRSNGTNLLVDISSDGVTNDIANGVSMGSISSGVWSHRAVGRSGNNFYTFKDGTLISTFSSSASIFSSSTPLYLGRDNATYMEGNINGLMILKGECLHTASFTAPTTKRFIEGSVYSFWSQVGSAGTDLHQYITATADYGTEGATYTITNTGATSGFLKIITYGYGIYSDSPQQASAEDSASINTHGYQTESIQQQYQQTTDLGKLEADRVVEFYRTPRTVLNKISYCANTSSQMMEAFLHLDVGDLIYVVNAEKGIDSWYYIQGVNFQTRSKLIFVDYIVKQAWTLTKGLTHVSVEFDGVNSGINYGYIPSVYSDNSPTELLFSCWVYFDAISVVWSGTMLAASTDNGGVRIGCSTESKFFLYANIFDSQPGHWRTDSAVFTTGQWYHVAAHYDMLSTVNDATLYIDGVAVASSEINAPSGTAFAREGTPLVLGSLKTATIDYGFPLEGKIKDARIYHMSRATKTAADLAASLYSDGVGGSANYDGMVFNPFVVRTEDEADFEDLTLTTEKLLEGYNGFVGSANGSPIVRLL